MLKKNKKKHKMLAENSTGNERRKSPGSNMRRLAAFDIISSIRYRLPVTFARDLRWEMHTGKQALFLVVEFTVAESNGLHKMG